jgi:hypothetical protein
MASRKHCSAAGGVHLRGESTPGAGRALAAARRAYGNSGAASRVVASAAFVALGLEIADPLIGLAVTVVISGDADGAARAYERAIELTANAVERAELDGCPNRASSAGSPSSGSSSARPAAGLEAARITWNSWLTMRGG